MEHNPFTGLPKFSLWAKICASFELYKKGLNDSDNHDGVVTHPEPESWSVKSGGS